MWMCAFVLVWTRKMLSFGSLFLSLSLSPWRTLKCNSTHSFYIKFGKATSFASSPQICIKSILSPPVHPQTPSLLRLRSYSWNSYPCLHKLPLLKWNPFWCSQQCFKWAPACSEFCSCSSPNPGSTPQTLIHLYWLQLKSCISYKCFPLTYKCLHAPCFFKILGCTQDCR